MKLAKTLSNSKFNKSYLVECGLWTGGELVMIAAEPPNNALLCSLVILLLVSFSNSRQLCISVNISYYHSLDWFIAPDDLNRY